MFLRIFSRLFLITLLTLQFLFPLYSYFLIDRPQLPPEKINAIIQAQGGKKEQKSIPKISTRNLEKFHGWWQMITRAPMIGFGFGRQTDNIDSFFFIDTTTDPISIRTLCGTPIFPRDCTNVDGSTQETSLFFQASETELVSVFDTEGPSFDNIFQSFWSLKLQPDEQILAVATESRPDWFGYVGSFGFARKIDEPPNPIRPFNDTDSAFSDVTDPVEIAKYIQNSLLLNHNGPQNINFKDGDYRTFYERQELFRKLVDEGITFKTPITRIRVSQPGEHFVRIDPKPESVVGDFTSTDVVTDIFTDEFSFATVGATVEICGFEGPWAALNGTYVNGVAINEEGAVPNPSPNHVDVSLTKKKGTWRNVFNHFLLDFDSSDEKKFPRNKRGWATKVEGKPFVKVTHHITSDMEYPAFRAAIEAMFYLFYQVSQHHSFNGYFKPGSIFLIDTWEELKEAIATNNFIGSADFPADNEIQTRINQNVPSGFYNNVTMSERGVTTYNDPFGITQAPGSMFDYNIVLANYIVQPKNLYFAIEGTPQEGPPLFQFDPAILQDFGYKPVIENPALPHASFIGMLGDISVVNGIPQPQNPDPEHFTLIGEDPTKEVRNSNSYYVGLINPLLTGGKKVGYLRWKDTTITDPFFFLITATFPPNVPNSVKFGREAMSRVISNFTRFFNSQNCDAVILDIRTNNGGLSESSIALAEFFGDDRAAFSPNRMKKDNGNSDFVDLNQFSYFNNVQQRNDAMFERFFVQQNEQNYPGSVFRGSEGHPKKVIILTDNAAISAGDEFPTFFLGENLDGNLGSFTTAKIIGDIDGRIKGFRTRQNPVPVSMDSNRLFDINGDPFSPIRFRADLALGNNQLGVTDVFNNQQSDLVAPSAAPSLRGTAGGNPLPNDWENTVWQDLGFLKPKKGHFDKAIPLSKPKVNDRTSWRDSWLEQAILEAIS